MKNKIALASAFLAASSFSTAEIVINEFLSFEGFVDMSYSHTDSEVDGANESENSFAVDQVEISWLFDFDPVTAQIDLQHDEGTDSGNEVEQAFATYHMDNGSAITAGRYASMIGFEAFEPTGLYQYSFAYDAHILAAPILGGIGDVTIIPGYANGIKYTVESDTTFFGISLQDEAFGFDNGRLGGDGASSYAIEVAGSMAFDNGISWFIGGAYEDNDGAAGDSYMLNSYVTFETGAWIFAGELNIGESKGDVFALGSVFGGGEDEEVLQGLLMANFAFSDAASITGRISYVNHEYDVIELDGTKFTLAHGYAFTDNLFLVTELSYADGEVSVQGLGIDGDSLLAAVELIFSF